MHTCQEFNLVKKICVVDKWQLLRKSDFENVINNYNDLFQGVGCLSNIVSIALKDGAVPKIDLPRKIWFKLKDRLKKELSRMEYLGVIEKVIEPIEWAIVH